MFIKNIPFSQVRRDIWDSVPPLAGVPGVLGVRVGAKSKSFFILYRNSLGKQKRYTLGRYQTETFERTEGKRSSESQICAWCSSFRRQNQRAERIKDRTLGNIG